MYRDNPQMSLEELALFNELFASRFGLHFPEHKREILANRLLPRLRANRLTRFSDYYLLLQYDLAPEQEVLISAITNNETYFFRETLQFEALQGDLLESLRASSPRAGQLRFLSAGCSSGEEPYTLNIFARRQSFGRSADWLHIDAIDIDRERIDMARRAIYGPGALRALNEEQIQRHFEPIDDQHFALRPAFRQGVRFAEANLLDLSTYRLAAGYDALFCRNVLIYFSEPALKTVIEHFALAVRPGGYLFLGHSESIIGLTKAFQAQRLGQCIAYRRVES